MRKTVIMMRNTMYHLRLNFLVLLPVALCFSVGCALSRQPTPGERQDALKLVDKGVLELREGNLQSAEAAFTMASELGVFPSAIDGLGCVAFHRGQLKRAERLFLRANAVDPTYTIALSNLALLYDYRGERARARELYERVLKSNPRNFRARNNYAVLLKEEGRASKRRIELEFGKAESVVPHPLIIGNRAGREE